MSYGGINGSSTSQFFPQMVNVSHTIFVVDDELSIRDSVQWLLESDGYHVRTYNSASAFLDTLEQDSCGFCFTGVANTCLVLDLKMPDMDGLQLQRFLTYRCPCLPIIFISGHANEQQIEQAMTAGAIAFLNKPFNDELLLKYIHRAFHSV